MALQYKINVLDSLKEKGYTTYTLRKEKLLGESTIQKLRGGLPVSWENLEVLCKLLDCNIGDIVEYVKED
jgi:putative transcriptional regulator